MTSIPNDGNVSMSETAREALKKMEEMIEIFKTHLLSKENGNMEEENPTVLSPVDETANPVNGENTIPVVMPENEQYAATVIETDEFKALKSKLVSIDNSIGDVIDRIDEIAEKDKIINRLHSELQSYKSGFRREIMMPLLKEIMRCHDNLTDLYKNYENKPETEFVTLYPQLQKEYKNLANWLTDLLYPYEIEIVEPKAGEEFNSLRHKRYKNIQTDDTEKDNKIESCFSAGFRDVEKDRLLKMPEVNVYKLI